MMVRYMILQSLFLSAVGVAAASDQTSRAGNGNLVRRGRETAERRTQTANGTGNGLVTVTKPVQYTGSMGAACRLNTDLEGEEGVDFTKQRSLTMKACMEACSGDASCAGYQHTTFEEGTTECHLWSHFGPEMQDDSNSVCFWKARECCAVTVDMETEFCANEGTGQPALKCGPSECEYDNYCLALAAANWLQSECKEQCAKPQTMNAFENPCEGQDTFSPVQCTHDMGASRLADGTGAATSVPRCVYDNICMAQQAGYTTLTSVCEDICPSPVNGGSGSTCAASSVSSCDSASNGSGFEGMGMNPSPSMNMGPNGKLVGPGGALVFCGDSQCPYDSLCQAMEAGFAMEQCSDLDSIGAGGGGGDFDTNSTVTNTTAMERDGGSP